METSLDNFVLLNYISTSYDRANSDRDVMYESKIWFVFLRSFAIEKMVSINHCKWQSNVVIHLRKNVKYLLDALLN